MSSLTALIVLLSVFHVLVMAIMLWIRIYRTKDERKTTDSAPVTPCAVCGRPATHRDYDGLDPNEQHDPHSGRAWSPESAHYQPLCPAH